MTLNTKLHKLLRQEDKGVSSANGALSKILRTFWKDLGFSHEYLGLLMERWLEDPSNEYDQDPIKLGNSRGNLRKDHERDDLTWKLFLRNLRVIRPKEVRFLIRLRLKDGSTHRQVAIMYPSSTKKFNSDDVIKRLNGKNTDDDGFVHVSPDLYDDEGFKKSEDGYLPRDICIFKEDDQGFYYCSLEDLIKHVDNLPDSDYHVKSQSVDELFEQVLPEINQSWENELADHLKQVMWADVNYNVIKHKGQIIDGQHSIIRAKLIGTKTLKVKIIDNLPKLSYIEWKDCGANLTARVNPYLEKRKAK